MKSITVQELKDWKDQNEDFQLIDVREEYEVEICTLHGLHIPMNEITTRYTEVEKDKKVVVHCRSGKRSENVILFLEQNFGFSNLYNLEGGILAWANEIDDSLETY
jgi:rhodanese-related sulfurtransferase